MNKGGISGVVTAVILIAMAVGLTTVVWVVISNMVNTGLDEAETGLTKLNLNIISGSVNKTSQTTIILKVDRGYDESDLREINFLLETEDGENEKITIPNNLEPGEGKTYTLSTNEMTNIDNTAGIIKISVAPVIFINGKEKTLPVTDTHKFEI